MKHYTFDIEADRLEISPEANIWCIVVQDVVTAELWRYGPEALQDGLDRLRMASTLIGHNIMAYDLPQLKAALKWTPDASCVVRDTTVMARMCFTDLANDDFRHKDSEIRSLAGANTLKAWGVRLGERKSDFGELKEPLTPILKPCWTIVSRM